MQILNTMPLSEKDLTRPKAILFDWDNTLADTWPIIFHALTQTFQELGHEPWSFEEVKSGKRGIHRSLRESFPEIFGDEWQQAKDIYYRHFLENHLKMIRKLPGSDAILESISEKEIYSAVVSNKTGPYLRLEVEHLGWGHHFMKVIGAADAIEDKPSHAPVHLALEGSGIKPGPDVWLVGDSETDLECARNAAIRPIIYRNMALAEKVNKGAHPKSHVLHVDDHHELLNVLKRL